MASQVSKLSLVIGTSSFSGEGDADWLTDQAKSFAALLSQPTSSPAAATSKTADEKAPQGSVGSVPLPTFLRTKDATTNQNRKFLATACWLQKSGTSEITTKSVTSALTTASQKKLGNASECLNQNVSKGFCEKAGKAFYVTSEGFAELGEEQ